MIPVNEFDSTGLLTPCRASRVWVADKTQSFNACGAKRQQYQRREHMTISAQVIDTIVEWIDDNLHQPLRIDDNVSAMPGIRNGIFATAVFTV